ncbi:MAG TPA: hypothetical protein VK447_11740, partial [Myxococcaceae bacterium]|nr:hypothetical protein [Myxococcaceae bacterium]
MAKVSSRTAPNPGAYRIEFSSSTWSQLGTVPGNVFQQVRRCLESIAAQSEIAQAGRTGERSDGPSLHRVHIG